MIKVVCTVAVLAGVLSIGSLACAQGANADGTGFAGAYAPSKIWQPPKDPLALEKAQEVPGPEVRFLLLLGNPDPVGGRSTSRGASAPNATIGTSVRASMLTTTPSLTRRRTRG